jgi:hypothetical protein
MKRKYPDLFSDSGTWFNFNDEISFLREENVNPQKLWKLIWTRIMNKITIGLIKKMDKRRKNEIDI